MIGAIISVVQWVFPNAFQTKAQVRNEEFRPQLDKLKQILIEHVDQSITWRCLAGGAVRFARGREIVATITIIPESFLRQKPSILVETKIPAVTAGARCAFSGMLVEGVALLPSTIPLRIN